MTYQQCPNIRVWLQGRDYVESSEILLDYNRIQPAAVIAGLAIEIFLKSFLAQRHETDRATTERGHDTVDLFERIEPSIQAELLACSVEIDKTVDFLQQLRKHDGSFVLARYWYEPEVKKDIGSDTVYFARHVCESVFLLGKKRGV